MNVALLRNRWQALRASLAARPGVRRAVAAVVAAVVALAIVIGVTAPDSDAAPAVPAEATAGPWTLAGWHAIPASRADQGLATVTGARGDRIVFRGNADVTRRLRAAGWWHIGDPGSADGFLVDAYQGHRRMDAKLFVVTRPDGTATEWIHRLAPGEMINNSFAAVTPDWKWIVSGEWHTISRLLVFPMPFRNAAARAGRNLPLATTIALTHPMRNVQGCSFATAIELICSTNDQRTDLYPEPRQLIAVRLARPVDGTPMTATPTLLGAVPRVSDCGAAETEGIDVHGGVMRVIAHEQGRCSSRVDLFTYRLRRPVAQA